MKLGMISLGCAKNLVDSERVLGLAKNYQFEITTKMNEADVIVVNTCGFIESAKKEALDAIFDALRYQKNHAKVIVMGCLVERYYHELKREIPEVDYFVRLRDYDRIGNIFDELTSAVKEYKLSYNNRLLATPKHSAYLKISDGCDNCCAYCAIPLIRGRYRSRNPEEILKEAKILVSEGVKEISVIAQDTTRYGTDLADYSLAKLLSNLAKIEGLVSLRVLYLYPDEITDELLEVIKNEPKLAKYFDIPIQHASSRLLKEMNRRGDEVFLQNLLDKIRTMIPDAIIRTTLIVGFPGETEEDFEILKAFVKRNRFERLGVFTYSDEENTKAHHMKNKVPEEIAKKRRDEIMQIQQEIVASFNESRLCKTETVVIDKYIPSQKRYLARSYKEAMDDIDGVIYVETDQALKVGEYYTVKITKNLGYDLLARLE